MAFAFGQVRESLTSVSDIALLDSSIFERLRFSAVSSAPLFLASEVGGLLQVYARWRIPFGHSDLAVMVSRLITTAEKCDAEVACNAVYCATTIVMNTSKSRDIGSFVSRFVEPKTPHSSAIADGINTEIIAIVFAVNSRVSSNARDGHYRQVCGGYG